MLIHGSLGRPSLYLIKTATFFIFSLALIGWGYHELHTPQINEPNDAIQSSATSKNKIKNDSLPETYTAQAATAPTWGEALSMVDSASSALQSVGLFNSPQSDISVSPSEPRGFSDNWNLSNTDLPSEVVFSYFESSEPEQIIYYTANGVRVIRPNQAGLTPQQEGQTLFVGTADSVANTAEERGRRAEAANQNAAPEQPGGKNTNEAATDGKEKREDLALPENAFRVVYFKPGKRDSGSVLVAANPNPSSALQGPDYSFENAASDDEETQSHVLSSVLSLGHGGEIMLKVAKNGYVRNEAGFDFAIFENAFRIAGLNLIFHEFAYVGVSDKPTPESFKWFDCKPQQQVLGGCIGAVPTSEGGDKFDLSDVGLERISYIWIRDTGKNKNFPSKWPTEGADLDAVRLYHAYRTQ